MRTVILFGFITLIMWLTNTYQLSLYINPRFSSLLEISGWILLPMAIIQALCIIRIVYAHEARHQNHFHGGGLVYAPFVILLALAFVLPGNTLNANLVNSKGINSQLSDAPTTTYEMSRPLAPKLQQMSKIEVTDRDYTEIMSELQFFPQDYIGKEVHVTGFVFRGPEYSDSQFSLVRYVIVCCTADALPYGILCEVKDAAKYNDGTWLTIQGVVQTTKHGNESVPTIKITSMQQVPEPKEPYVFPRQ